MFKTSKDYKIYPITCTEKIREAEFTFTYNFEKPDDLTWEEGAHAHVALDKFDESIGWFQKKDLRHLSITSLPEEDIISITTRIPELRSSFKDELSNVKQGDTLYLFKIGSHVPLRREKRPITLLSAGVALSTMRPLIHRYVKDDSGIPELHSLNVDSHGRFLFADEMSQYEQNAQYLSVEYTERRDLFYKFVENKVKTDQLKGIYYVIGSEEYVEEVYFFLKKLGVSRDSIVLDKKAEYYNELESSKKN